MKNVNSSFTTATLPEIRFKPSNPVAPLLIARVILSNVYRGLSATLTTSSNVLTGRSAALRTPSANRSGLSAALRTLPARVLSAGPVSSPKILGIQNHLQSF